LYVVPANVAGTWRLPQGELTLEQAFQAVYGTYEVDGIRVPIEHGHMRGEEIHFTINAVEYFGRVSGDTMEGIEKGRVTRAWSAQRSRE
jgi:hypothetical protein